MHYMEHHMTTTSSNLSYTKIKNKKSFLCVIKSYLLCVCDNIRGDNALYVVKLCVEYVRMIYVTSLLYVIFYG